MKIRAELFLDESARAPVHVVMDRECASMRAAGRALMAVADAYAAHLAYAYTRDESRGCALVRHAGGGLEDGANVLWRAGEWRVDVFLRRTHPGGDDAVAAGADPVAWRLAETVAVIRATIA